MKVVVAVLALVAVAYAQTQMVTFTNGIYGYDNDCQDVDKANGVCYGSFPVAATMRPNATQPGSRRIYLVIGVQSKNINTNGAVIEIQAKSYKGSVPSTWTIADETIIAKAAADADKIIYGSVDFQPTYSNGTYNWMDGVALAATVKSCTSCSKSADFKITAFLAIGVSTDCHPINGQGKNTPPNLDLCILQPFMITDNKFTWDYELPAASYGVAGWTMGPTPPADFQMFAAIDIQGTGTASVSLVYSKNTLYSAPTAGGSALPTTIPQDGSLYVVPRGTTRSGDFRTGGLALTGSATTTWYIQPFVNNAGTGGGRAPFDIAYGINHEPSAAGIAVPSVLIAAILAIAALLL
jgi:hypothetical protein